MILQRTSHTCATQRSSCAFTSCVTVPRLRIAHPPHLHALSANAPWRGATAAPVKHWNDMRRARYACCHAGGDHTTSEPHLQLGTAKLPGGIDLDTFQSSMFQWATTLTQSGANLPFAKVLRVDKVDRGFQIGLLKRMEDKSFASAGDITATVEEVAGAGQVLFIRFYEGPAAVAGRQTPMPADAGERLDVVLKSLVDVDLIMSTMPVAIKKAVAAGGMAAQAAGR